MSTGIEIIIGAYITEAQNIEDALVELLTRTDIDVISGNNLDRLGALVGQGREGFSDAKYRLFIKGKIGVNTSESDIEKVNTVFKLLTNATQVAIVEIFPASVSLFSDVAIPAGDVALITSLMEDVVAAGVSIESIGPFPAAGTFGFSPASAGFSSDGTTGGGPFYNPS